MKRIASKHIIFSLFMCGVLVCLALASYKLSETPPTWMDEGALVQVSLNLALHGVYGYQVAPETFVPAGFLTTSYPLLYPVAAAIKMFGPSLLVVRMVMVIFLLCVSVLSFVLIRRLVVSAEGNRTVLGLLPILSLFLVVSFAPVYGNGKNMLGEIPGIMFMLLALFILSKVTWSRGLLLVAGACAGLAMVTKPIFIVLLLPALIVATVIHRKGSTLLQKVWLLCGVFVPIALWLCIHFGGEPLLGVFTGNPDGLPLLDLIQKNIRHLIFEIQPLYFLTLMIVWWVSLLVRRLKKVPISFIETIAVSFSTLNIAMYLATLGYYRYFFPGELIALIFFPLYTYAGIHSFTQLAPRLEWVKKAWLPTFVTVVVLLIGFHFHQTLFNSWVSEYASSTRTALLKEKLGSLPKDASIYFYNVPEAVLFRPGAPYYQYFRFADSVQRGNGTLPLLEQGIPRFVLTDTKYADAIPLGTNYIEKQRFDKYVFYEKK